MLISSWLCPKCTFILLYTTLNLKACKINYRKKCVGVSPEERPYDVSRRQNRYVTLPLATSNVELILITPFRACLTDDLSNAAFKNNL